MFFSRNKAGESNSTYDKVRNDFFDALGRAGGEDGMVKGEAVSS